MNRSYLVHFLRKINAERAACARGKKGESGGEFDSLSTPPPAFPRNSRMRRKKARPLRVSFHSSGFVYPLPDKKALLARLSFVTDIPFVRGSRFSSSLLSFSSLKYYRRDYYRHRRANASSLSIFISGEETGGIEEEECRSVPTGKRM